MQIGFKENAFMRRVARHWNGFLREVVGVPFLEVLKAVDGALCSLSWA